MNFGQNRKSFGTVLIHFSTRSFCCVRSRCFAGSVLDFRTKMAPYRQQAELKHSAWRDRHQATSGQPAACGVQKCDTKKRSRTGTAGVTVSRGLASQKVINLLVAIRSAPIFYSTICMPLFGSLGQGAEGEKQGGAVCTPAQVDANCH